MDIFLQFVSRWGASTSLPPASPLEIADFEASEVIQLPRVYARFIGTYGFPFTPGLLNAIVEAEADLHDVQNFEPLNSMASTTRLYESAGMPFGYLAIANDCMGNGFLLRRSDCNGAEDASIWFFDHDLGTVEFTADSFSEFIARYAALARAA